MTTLVDFDSGATSPSVVAPQATSRRRVSLTIAEEEQVARILAERRTMQGEPRIPARDEDRADAIACVIADRKTCEMVCHGGEVETI